jgi:5-methylcytosine-specific restriction endonuclease McrA
VPTADPWTGCHHAFAGRQLPLPQPEPAVRGKKPTAPLASAKRNQSRRGPSLRTIADLEAAPTKCANCGGSIAAVGLFCSELCRDEASWVRYARACRLDGRIRRPDVAQAIRIKLAHILAGGYDRRARRLSAPLRKRIFDRDRGSCRLCGRPGKEIDHIAGGSNDESNLQLLCWLCHVKKTTASMVRISKESHPEAWEASRRLRSRAEAEEPVQFCDSPSWGEAWRGLLADRRRRAKKAEQ